MQDTPAGTEPSLGCANRLRLRPADPIAWDYRKHPDTISDSRIEVIPEEDPLVILGAINATLGLFRAARELLVGAKRGLRRAHYTKFPTPRALQRALVRKEVVVGDTVKVDGYLSRYAHLARPISFLNSRLDTARMDSIAQQRGIRAGRGFVAAHLAAQNPVSTLPSFTVEDESTRCLFLYTGSHDRFLYSRPTAKGDSLHSLQIPMLDPRVAIPDDAWPIPILLPADTALRSAETRAQLTAVVRELPPELARKFGALYGQHYDQRVLSNFLFLPGEPSLCYCLSVLPSDQDAGIESALPAVSPVDRALLYVEGHVSGERPDLTAIEEALALPGLGHFTQQAVTKDGGVSFPLSLDGSRPKAPADEQYRLLAAPFDITINLKAPNVVGLYAETTPTRDLPVRVQDLLTMWTGLRGGLEDIERRQGSPLTLSTDFMFDFDRQALFDPKGLLPPAEDEVAEESDVSDARTWLRSPGSGA